MKPGYFLLLLVLPFIAEAQNEVKEFFDVYGKKTDKVDSYTYIVGKKKTFIREAYGRKDTVDSYIDTVKTYFTKTDLLKSKIHYNKDGYKNGDYVLYYANGKLQEQGTFVNGNQDGYVKQWYENGNPHCVLQHFKDFGVVSEWYVIDFKILNYWNITGRQLIIDGNGMCSCYFDDDSETMETGSVKHGIRDSLWITTIKGQPAFEETYQKGQFVKGIRLDDDNTEYFEMEERAEFTGGQQAMMKHLLSNLRYPKSARKKRIEGQVFVHLLCQRMVV